MRIALSLLLASAGSIVCAQSAERILHNATIYTVNDQAPWAEAIAIAADGEILAVGDEQTVMAFADGGSELINLQGRLVLPGFQDTHAHVLDASSAAQGDCQLDPQAGLEDWQATLADCQAAKPDGWLLGWGHSLHTLLEQAASPRAVLDEISREQPIAIMEETSHSYWLNSAALAQAGIHADTPDPQGGVILKDADGEPTGVVLDNAGDLAMDKALAPSQALQAIYYQAVLDGQAALAENGITSVADARVFWRRGHLQAWQQAAAQKQLLARTTLGLWAYPGLDDAAQLAELKAMYHTAQGDELLSVSQIKFYVDGIVHNTTARLAEPYDDSLPGVDPRGVYYFTPQRLKRYVRELAQVGFDAHIHAIGDQAVSDALDAVAGAGQGRHRLTHVELVKAQDIPRFAKLGVIADFQPSQYFQPSFLADNYPLIGRRADQMLPMRALYNSGARVTLSSDWDVNPLSPLGILQNALSLGERSLPSLEAAIRAYTLDAAYTLRQEHTTGSLEVGKQADLVVLSNNLFELPVAQIGEVQVLWTLLGGEETYRSSDF